MVKMIREIETVTYHRNGVMGEGFFRLDFTDYDGDRLIGIVAGTFYCVIDPARPRMRFRGDHFVDEMIAATKDQSYLPHE